MAKPKKNEQEESQQTEESAGAEDTTKGPSADTTSNLHLSPDEVNEIRNIIARNSELEQSVQTLQEQLARASATKTEETRRKRDPNEVLVRMRRYSSIDENLHDRLILGWVKRAGRAVYSERDPQNTSEQIEYIDLKLEGINDPVKTRYTDFLSSCPQETFPAKRRLVKVDEQKLGDVERRIYDSSSGEMRSTGLYTENVVVSHVYEYVVSLPNNKTITLPSEFINA